MKRATNGRDVVIGLVVTTARVGARGGRLVLLPARVVARSTLARPLRGRADNLSEVGRLAEVDARRRLETVAAEVLAAPETEQVVDGVLAGPLPKAVAGSLVEHQVVERVVAELLARSDGEPVASELETERAERLVAQVLASPALERLLVEALESQLTLDLADRLVRSPAFDRVLGHVASSPELRAALVAQSTSLAEEMADGLRRRTVKLDDAAERGPRRWVRRSPRPQLAPDGPPPVPYAGVATRGIGLAVDAALVAMIVLTGTAVLDLVVSLFWHPGPAWLVGTLIALAGLLVHAAYFVGFWTTAGQTPGMRLMRIRVVDSTTGSDPDLGRSLLRLVGLYLSVLLLFTGFLPVLVDDRRRALQDFMARTVVQYDERAPLQPGSSIKDQVPPVGRRLVRGSRTSPEQPG
jgi:uncharacterized RDD family membrane protein YckC